MEGPAQPAPALLTLRELEEIRAEVFAEDVPILPEMASWSRAAIAEYFETGGAAATGAQSTPPPSVAVQPTPPPPAEQPQPLPQPQPQPSPQPSPPLLPSSADVLSRNGTYEKALDALPLLPAEPAGRKDTAIAGLAFRRCKSSPAPRLMGGSLDEALRALPIVAAS